jgi:exo-beta-1,3-glucanase (GH17 family)
VFLIVPSAAQALTYKFAAASQGYVTTGQEGYGAFSRNSIQFLIRYGGAGGGRGFNITVVDERTGDVLDFRNYDLWLSGQAAAEQMIAYLAGLPSGRVILFAIADEGGLRNPGSCSPRASWIEDVYTAFESLGSEHIRDVCFREAWAMISKKGVTPAKAEVFGVGPRTASAAITFSSAVAIKGVDYAPFRIGEAPSGPCPSAAEIQADMPALKAMANRVRIYGLAGCDIGQKILSATNAARIRTAVGVWLSDDLTANEAEITKLTELMNEGLFKRTDVVIVGSEVLLREEMSVTDLIGYINRVKTIVLPRHIPVTTAEIWPIWLDSRGAALAGVVDQIFMNALPYWEKIPADQARASVLDRFTRVWSAYPFKRVLISETGWPSDGPINGQSIPSLANQRLVLTTVLCEAKKKRMPYYILEAFDQPWKVAREGEVGAHWGFRYVDRQPKHSFTSLKSCPSD